jgi:hypothetical protein
MSRTRKGSKPIGLDFNSKRLLGYPPAMTYYKKLTHRHERTEKKRILLEEAKDYSVYKGKFERLCENMITGEFIWMPVEVEGVKKQ